MPLDREQEDPLRSLIEEADPLVRYDALTAAQATYKDLVKRVARERARAVAQMRSAGLSYASIAAIIGGYTRSRVQQLVESVEHNPTTNREGWLRTMAAQEELVGYIRSFVEEWPRIHQVPFGHRLPQSMADRYTAEQVAEQLVADAAFRAIKFGTWLGTPQGQLVAAAVEALAPPLVARDVELLTAALDIAIGSERTRRKEVLVAKALVGAGIAALAWGLRGGTS